MRNVQAVCLVLCVVATTAWAQQPAGVDLPVPQTAPAVAVPVPASPPGSQADPLQQALEALEAARASIERARQMPPAGPAAGPATSADVQVLQRENVRLQQMVQRSATLIEQLTRNWEMATAGLQQAERQVVQLQQQLLGHGVTPVVPVAGATASGAPGTAAAPPTAGQVQVPGPVTQSEQPPPAAPGVAAAPGITPPPQNVQADRRIVGRIDRVEEGGRLIGVNVGSAQGVVPGLRMLISRNGDFIAHLDVLHVAPASAAGQAANTQKAPQVGDIVFYTPSTGPQ